jgi:hypothetical protein
MKEFDVERFRRLALEIATPIGVELVAGVRREFARVLHDEAEGEPEVVAKKLRAVAAAFECGQRPGAEDE